MCSDLAALLTPLTLLPRLPFGKWVNSVVEWLVQNWAPFFDGIAHGLNSVVKWLQDGLMTLPILTVVVVLALIALLARGWLSGVLAAVGLLLIDSLGQWQNAMETLALVVVASVVAVALSVPLGIAAAKSRSASVVTRPVMDFMQTLPSFVYLLPAMFFFGLGASPAVLATIVFAMPPGVRLTELGIRQVDPEVVEAGQAFGAPPRAVLRGIQIPLALPTIMAGVNQVIMLSLSMTVIAGLVGAGGLGGAVVQGLQTLDVALSAEAGVAVVILAIYLDRVTAAFGQGDSLLAGLRKRWSRQARPQAPGAAAEGVAGPVS